MNIKFTPHLPKEKGYSSGRIFDYLCKEEYQKIKEAEQSYEIGEMSKEEFEQTIFNEKDTFFNQDFDKYNLEGQGNHISASVASQMIDDNTGTRSKNEANFYSFSISPSKKELQHLEKLTEDILRKRGLDKDKIFKQGNPELKEFYQDQFKQVMEIQLKDYAKDVMNEYAKQFGREVYVNQDKLPDDKERREMLPEIERRYSDYLKEIGVKIKDPEVKEEIYISLEYRDRKELEKGSIFNIYDKDLNRNYNLYVPNEKCSIEGNKVQIREDYFVDKYDKIRRGAEYDNESINIQKNALEIGDMPNSKFKDFQRDDKIIISYNYEAFQKDIPLYFSKNECNFVNGNYEIKEAIYKEKVYQAQVTFLNKEFADKRQEIFNEKAQEKGYDFTKITNDEGKEVFAFPDKVPQGKDLKRFNTEVSVSFNKYLVDNKYLPKKEEFSVSNWKNTTEVQGSYLMETEKAVLIRFEDDRLKEPMQTWVPKYAIPDNEISISENPETTKINISSEFYEHKVKSQMEIEQSHTLSFEKYNEISSIKQTYVKNKDSVSFTYEVEGLKTPLTFQIEKEKLDLVNGEYTMQRAEFESRYKAHLVEHCKEEFKEDYERIQTEVSERLTGERQHIIDRETDKEFRHFLAEKDILQEGRNDKYIVQGQIEEQKENSSMLKIKVEGYEKEVKLWVNNKDFEINDKNEISFKDREQAEKLINNAVDRDKEKSQLVEITYDKVEVTPIETKGEQSQERPDNMVTFYRKEEGLTEPIKITFKESDLQKIDDKYFVEKYSLDFREQKAIEYGIEKEHGSVRENIKNEVWRENGFDPTKRELNGDDLLWFGKIEHERKYTHEDKRVLENREIFKELNVLKSIENPTKQERRQIENLEKSLHRDPITKDIIREGVLKGGNQTHVHIVVSRHDRTSVNPKDKVSMSPLSNQRESTINGQKVGFDRKEFFRSTERIFDEKFEYDRPLEQTFDYQNGRKNGIEDVSKTVSKSIEGQVKNKAKEFIKEHTGFKAVKNEIDIRKPMKEEFRNIPIPTSLPKTKVQAVIKAIKSIARQVSIEGHSLGY